MTQQLHHSHKGETEFKLRTEHRGELHVWNSLLVILAFLPFCNVHTDGSGAMEDDRCRLIWKNGEDVKKWILRVETYAAACGWNENKMAAMAAIGLPDDKVEFLLTVPEEDRKDWPKLKKAIVTEYRTELESCEQAFLA